MIPRPIWENVVIPAMPSCEEVKVKPAKHIYNGVLVIICTHTYEKWCFSLVPHASDSSFDTIVCSVHRRTKVNLVWFKASNSFQIYPFIFQSDCLVTLYFDLIHS